MATAARASHCSHGHPWSEANTYWYNGRRECRACRNEAMTRPVETVSADRDKAETADRNMRRALFRYGARYGLPNMSRLQCISELRLLDRILDDDLALADKVEAEIYSGLRAEAER